jgi:hypothetical protein
MDFSAGTIKRISEHVIEIFFIRDSEIDEKMALDILSKIVELSAGGPHALLYDFNKKNVLLSDIAKKLSGVRNYNNVNLISRAMVTQSMVSNIESSHYVQNTKPEAETKVFDDREKALTWLNIKIETFLQT